MGKVGKRANNEGSLYLRKGDGRWVAALTHPDGKQRSKYFETQRAAKEYLTTARRELQQGLPLPTGRLTLAAFLEQWLAAVRPTLAPKSAKDYGQIVRNHLAPGLGALIVDQVTPQRIQTFLNTKHAGGLSPRTVQYMHAVLRAALEKAVEWNLVARNNAKLAKPPRLHQKEVTPLEPGAARAIMAAFAGDPLETLVATTLALGLRQGEALGLRWSDIDLEAGKVEVRHQVRRVDGDWAFAQLKTFHSRRALPLPAFLSAALRDHRTRQHEHRLSLGPAWTALDLVFPNPRGEPRSGVAVTHAFEAKLQQAGLPRMTFHDLRHGAATLLLAQGVDLKTIQEILGHSTITVTATFYAHVAPKLKRDAADRMHAALGG